MSKRWGGVLAGLVNIATLPQKPWRRAASRLRVAEALVQRHPIETKRGRILFVSPAARALEYPRDFWPREPEMLDWIDGFETPCLYWDIGANVGSYVLYAALRPDVMTYAFEPSPSNYFALSVNLYENGRQDNVRAYCLAFDDRMNLATLDMDDLSAGSFGHSFGPEPTVARPEHKTIFHQPAIGFSIDGFRDIYQLAAPNYLKLDIDGNEEKVLAGAAATLADPALRAVMIEVDKQGARTEAIFKTLEGFGFRFVRWGVDHGLGTINAEFVRRPTR
ncbi:MAG TPA: FkbM family methyltransferase [Stellaceae bacterium]|jgi:FkbM family methyltransferase|nr:FkbM family methyltransferase [Stellaceae bacterium]